MAKNIEVDTFDDDVAGNAGISDADALSRVMDLEESGALDTADDGESTFDPEQWPEGDLRSGVERAAKILEEEETQEAKTQADDADDGDGAAEDDNDGADDDTDADVDADVDDDADDDSDDDGLEEIQGIRVSSQLKKLIDAGERLEFTVDGEKVNVDFFELARGWGMQSASTKRFQQAAEMRKQNEADAEVVRMQAQGLEALGHMLDGYLPQDAKNQLRAIAQNAAAESQRVAEHREAEWVQSEAASLKAMLALQGVNTKNESDLQVVRQRIVSAAEKRGFSTEELAGADHRMMAALHELGLRDSVGLKTSVPRKQKETTPSLRPGSKPPGKQASKKRVEQKRALGRLKQTGNIEDGVAALLSMPGFIDD